MIDPSDLERVGRNYVDGLVADSRDARVAGRVERGHVLAQEPGDNAVVAVALRWAFSAPGVESVTLVQATFLPIVVGGWYARLVPDLEALDHGAMTAIEAVIEAAGDPREGLRLEREPLRGKPGLALADASREFDLLVVGPRGRGAWRELVLGFTSAVAASYAHCPVAVIR